MLLWNCIVVLGEEGEDSVTILRKDDTKKGIEKEPRKVDSTTNSKKR